VGTGGTATGGNSGDGYRVEGNKILDANGKARVFRGIARPSLEWDAAGEHVSADDFKRMASWGANIARIGMNQVFWLRGGRSGSQNRDLSAQEYQALIAQAVQWSKDAGMDVILDLHWSDRGKTEGGAQHDMPDSNSLVFWEQVAGRYKRDPRVLFELYNEPKVGGWSPSDADWKVWRDGGPVNEGYTAVGMQALYDGVRSTGAENIVIIGGLNWAYDLRGVKNYRIKGFNIAYSTHPYSIAKEKQPDSWDTYWGFLAATDPIFITEFGTFDCSTSYYNSLISYAETKGVHWTAWAWYPGGCGFPSVLSDWNGTPNAPGAIIKSALGK
jgi:aryl-phospho-beta-D-glucosidase BglC (GH1 family)